jgi:hypothetical protein
MNTLALEVCLRIGVLLRVFPSQIAATSALSLYPKTRPVHRFSLIVSASALVLMVAIWLPKQYFAHALNKNSAMAGEATRTCSLSCIQITIILFVGSLIFRLWTKGWWVDGATALILGARFGWEGYYKMVRPKFRW